MDDDGSEIETLAWLARLLGSATRLILWRTVGPVGMYPSDLASTLDITATTASYHLRQLHEAGLLTVEQQGRNRLYRWSNLRFAIVPDADLQALINMAVNPSP